MDLEYIPVIVSGVWRQFPMSHIKIHWRPGDDSSVATVRVDYPSYSIEGEITIENMKKLIEFGERTNTKMISLK